MIYTRRSEQSTTQTQLAGIIIMHTPEHCLADFESYNALIAAPINHSPAMDTTTRNILDHLLTDLMNIREIEFNNGSNLNGYIGMDICTSVLARLVDGSLSDNATH
jgi:hypothetical protein